jgi:hypothetical protein
VFDVIQKLQAIGGINYIKIGDKDVKGVASKEQLCELLVKPLTAPDPPKSDQASIFDSSAPPINTVAMAVLSKGKFNPQLLGDFIDSSGNKASYFSSLEWFDTFVTAGPISLAGQAFKLTVTFQEDPGYAVKHPDKALVFPQFGPTLFPLAITQVRLTSLTKLSPDVCNSIAAAINSKYGPLDPLQARNLQNQHTTISGNDDGPSLTVDLDDGYIEYDYLGRADLHKFYQDHLIQIDQQAVKKVPDTVNNL